MADGGAGTVDARPDLPADAVPGRETSGDDAQPPPDAVDAPAVPEVGLEASLDLPPLSSDMAPAVAPTGPDGTATCLAAPAREDLLADFEAGTATMVVVDGRGGDDFNLVQSGAGEIGILSSPAQGACGSPSFMRFAGMAIPAGRTGHLAARFVRPMGSTAYLDARAFSGVRLSVRSARPLALTVKLADSNTIVGGRPYDHFSTSLNVISSWRTYVIPLSQFRQSGVGTPQPGLNLAQLFAIELQVLDRDFELFVDTIAFTRVSLSP